MLSLLAGIIATFTDSRNWTQATSGTSNELYDVAHADNKWVAVGESGTIVTSSDSSTWRIEKVSMATDVFYAVAYH